MERKVIDKTKNATPAQPETPVEVSQISKFLVECGQNAHIESFVAQYDSLASFEGAIKFTREQKRHPPKFERDFEYLLRRVLLVNTTLD
jgi:hypothetical protein